MKKFLRVLSVIVIVLAIASVAAQAQSKIIKKTVKKVVTPQITPAQPPKVEPTKEVVPDVPPPPPPPPDYNVQPLKHDKGLLGWGWNTDVNAKLLSGSILFALRGDLVYDDPLKLGEKIGLAEDAVVYKLGLGAVISDKLKSLPLFADAVVYLKEGSLFGLDPFIGTGLIYNLYGTGRASGGLGGQAYLGILADFGLEQRTELSVGYATYAVANNITDSGIFVTIGQPIKL